MWSRGHRRTYTSQDRCPYLVVNRCGRSDPNFDAYSQRVRHRMGEFSGSFARRDTHQEVAAVDIRDSSTAFPSILVHGAAVDGLIMGLHLGPVHAERELRVPSRLCFQGDHAIALMARIDRSEPSDGYGNRSRLDDPLQARWQRYAKEARRARCHLTVADEGGPLGGAFEDSHGIEYTLTEEAAEVVLLRVVLRRGESGVSHFDSPLGRRLLVDGMSMRSLWSAGLSHVRLTALPCAVDAPCCVERCSWS